MKTATMLIGLLLCVARAALAQAPICIVDGVQVPPRQCSFPDGFAIAGRQIQHVEIVKGAAAAGLYGADAVNGVVVITTTEAARRNADPLTRFLFPTELVMSHQQAIGLTDRQRSAIQEAMKEPQPAFVDLQFRMSAEVEKLQELVQSTTVDEAKVLRQVDRVLDVEREVKHRQLALLIRVKNLLTEQQQAALAKLRD